MNKLFKILSAVGLTVGLLLPQTQAEESLPTIYELHRGFIEANGGESNLLKLMSVIVNGYIEQEDQKIAFQLIRKRPNKMRMTLSINDFTISTIYNGEKGWRKVFRYNQRIALTEVQDEELDIMIEDSKFDSPFYSAFKKRKYITVAELDEVNGQEAVRLDFDPAGNFSYKSIWISLDNYQEVKIQRVLPSGDDGDEPQIEEIIYDDFQLVDGVYWAKTMEYYLNGEFKKEIKISDVRSNEGIYDSYFTLSED